MKSSVLVAFVVTIASAASSVSAASCNKGGVYCGQSLLNKGNYHDHIVQVLEAVGQPVDSVHIENSLFNCGSGGDIAYVTFCSNGCGGVGSTQDDFCL